LAKLGARALQGGTGSGKLSRYVGQVAAAWVEMLCRDIFFDEAYCSKYVKLLNRFEQLAQLSNLSKLDEAVSFFSALFNNQEGS
jgi:hypothetical protein